MLKKIEDKNAFSVIISIFLGVQFGKLNMKCASSGRIVE